MKRSVELAPLSRDHHKALEVAVRLRRVNGETLTEAIEHFLSFWTRHEERHFVIEERLLLPAVPEDDGDWTAATRRVREEHGEIRNRAAALPGAPSLESARELGELLRAHVRYEERHLFPMVEERLSPDARAALGRALTAAQGAA
jgi:hemerythrin-like domain-containing protein